MPFVSFDRLLVTRQKFTPQERSQIEMWQAEFTEPIIDPQQQLDSVLPALLSDNILHPEMKLVSVDFVEQDIRMPNIQTVLFHYSNRWELSDGTETEGKVFVVVDNPNDEPAHIQRGYWTTNKIWETDLDGLPICTTAGERILHQEEVEYTSWTIQKKVPKYPEAFGSAKVNRMFINSDKVTFDGETWDKYTLLIRSIAAGNISQKNSYLYYPLSFQMLFNPDTWLAKKRNAGFISLQPQKANNNRFSNATILKPGPIKVGNPASYPTQPVPIQNEPNNLTIATWPKVHGMVFPEFISTDPIGAPGGFTDSAILSPERLKEIWKLTELTFRTKAAIKFTNKVPLK